MNEEKTTAGSTAGWDTYWQGARHGEAYTGRGGTHPSILSFWDQFFSDFSAVNAAPRIVDVASGNGALVERAAGIFGSGAATVCLDVSEAAVRGLAKRFAQARCIVADARTIPLKSETADLVVSQFGIEYAGAASIDEAARLVAGGGRLGLLLHHRHGEIFRQCSASAEAVQEMQAARFLPCAIDMFEAGFAALRGADRSHYEAALKRMIPAVHTVESILRRHGAQVADSTIARLYNDVKTMHQRMPNYDSAEVLAWLAGMRDEVTAYAGRMASMCEAALGQSDFDALCDRLRKGGLKLLRAGPLVDPGSGTPLAWSLVALRPQGPGDAGRRDESDR